MGYQLNKKKSSKPMGEAELPGWSEEESESNWGVMASKGREVAVTCDLFVIIGIRGWFGADLGALG